MVGFDIAQGNPGCIQFLAEAYDDNMFNAESGFGRMQENNIKGEKLYRLWNDCCDRNTKKAVNIMCNNEINDILEHINYDNVRGIPYSDKE